MIKNFEIIKCRETDNMFYGVYQEDYDEKNERTILQYGKTELECLYNCMKVILEKYNQTNSCIRKILEMLADDSSLKRDLEIPWITVPRPYKNEHTGQEIEGFSSLIYDEKDGLWYKFYR